MPDAWTAKRGYKTVNTYLGEEQSALYRGTNRDLSIVLRPNSPPRGEFPHGSDPTFLPGEDRWGSAGRASFELPDGLPVGADAFVRRVGRGGFKVRFLAPHAEGMVLLSNALAGPARRDLTPDEERFVAAAARHVVALCEGARLVPEGTRPVAGGEIPVQRADDDLLLADLAAWAKLRGWSLALDDDAATTTLTKGGRKLLVPLGAMKVREGEAWRDLPALVVLVGDKWYVPLDALEKIAKG